MVLILILGDLHIPHGASDIPAKLKRLLVPGKIQLILSTGNICDRETWEWLKSVGSDVRGVAGEWDDVGQLGPTLSMTLPGSHLTITLISAHRIVPNADRDILQTMARCVGGDVVCCGGPLAQNRGDGEEEGDKASDQELPKRVIEVDNKLYINPGSATGASCPGLQHVGHGPSSCPSFVLLDVQGSTITAYTYHLVGQDDHAEVKVSKTEYKGPSPSISHLGQVDAIKV